MKLTNHFDVLLRDTVNLSPTRLAQLSERVDRIYSALSTDAQLDGVIVGMSPQGSWAHRTIINPVGEKEFDADFLLVMKEVDAWGPSDYIEQVYAAIHRHSIYKDMPHNRKCRCVRLVYSNSCHVDIVPTVTIDSSQYIVNRDENIWEPSNPQGFTDWMHDRDQATKGNLRKVIRLVKFLRDHKNSFTGTRSIILTTLLGEQVSQVKQIFDPGYYADVPTTLVHLMDDLDVWLQARPAKPSIADPSDSGLTFDHRWTETSYLYFRDRVNVHAAEMRDALNDPDKESSVAKWKVIFGDGFKAPVPADNSGRFGKTAVPAMAVASLSGRAG
ncbi:SMODS domain-containing nucleotidyltransferase [Herbiconiux sp. YIM B11900]|uniref:SMODS domain-containing nucleotidyltransferase n=1 Tax=Herbiconiux sp. YIM B11900 TaxID=3404131 RepID=UPI003F832F4B